MEMMPLDGVYATRALLDAGDRPEEKVSSPRPKAPNEEVTDTPAPFDDPEPNAAAR
jgi:hypothetical protein